MPSRPWIVVDKADDRRGQTSFVSVTSKEKPHDKQTVIKVCSIHTYINDR
jgi:hypothetical protein